MSFDIEKMKADGVSEHLIYLASVAPEVLMIRVARRLENDRLFQQFMGETADEIEKIYPYAVAAGLMSESDRKWLVDAGNPYKPQGGEVWYTGTLGECNGGVAQAYLAETDKANTADIIANHESYSVSLNGIEIEYAGIDGDAVVYSDTGSYQNFNVIAFLATENATATAKCPTDITTVEITVSHK